MEWFDQARRLLSICRKNEYIYGIGVTDQLGGLAARFGTSALIVSTRSHAELARKAKEMLLANGVRVLRGGAVPGARPNSPREDVYRLESYLLHDRPDLVVAIGGGSTLDACKAAIALAALGGVSTPEIDHYFGTGIVTEELKKFNCRMIPLIAVQTASSSGSHLTKYANVTDPAAGQKKLIVDDAVVPAASLFDYASTVSLPPQVTMAGAMDAFSHTFEVFCGADEKTWELKKDLAETALELIIRYTKKAMDQPGNLEAREALGLASDLGGYAIMAGGTSGGHLTSFSLVDLTAHGVACGLMNPYYAVFYAPKIQKQLGVIGSVLFRHGFITDDMAGLSERGRAEAVARGLIAFERSIGAPASLRELEGFTDAHIDRILSAAKDPQLSMKLKNMPVSMTGDDVDAYMAPIIHAAADGDLSLIKWKQ